MTKARKSAAREQAIATKRDTPPSRATLPDPLTATGASREWQLRLVLGILLALSTFLVYARVLNHEFTYLDDRTYVTENPTVQKGLTWEGVKWAFTTVHGANWHPLTWLSHMLDCSIFGLEPGGHHFTSVTLHVFNVILLFYLLSRMTGSLWPSAFVAGAFGLHPAHVESVAWVAERKDVLSTCFGLLAMIAYVRYAKGPRPHPHPRPSPLEGEGSGAGNAKAYLLVVGFFALSLMAKPMLVTLPFVLLLLDYWPLRRAHQESTPLGPPFLRGEAWWRLVVEKIPLLMLAAASSAVTVYAQRAGGAMMTEEMLSGEARLSNAIVSYGKYLWMTIWPAGLAVYYPHPLKAHPAAAVLAAALLLLALTAVALVLRKKHPFLLVGWLWFLGTLVPVIGLVQVGGQALADRYTYVPMIGLFIMAAWGVKGLVYPPVSPLFKGGGFAMRACGIIVLLLLSICTWVQTGYWRDSVTLFQRALDVVPNNTQGHLLMANALIRIGKVQEAVPHFGEAVRLVPNEPYNLTDYGQALLDSGKADQAAARLEEALALLPDFADAHYFLGVARIQQNRHAEAVKHLDTALARNPKLLKAHFYLGAAYEAQNNCSLAISHLQKWLQVDPRSVEALIKLSQCYVSMGREPEALSTLQKAWDINPKNPHPPALMGQIAAMGGEIESAIILYDKALAIDPHYADAANNLAQILSLHPAQHFRDGKRAVQLAEIAVAARKFQDPLTLDTLAAAYAEAGRFPDAMRTIDSAIELGRKLNDDDLMEHLESRRKVYAAGKPARAE